MKTLKKDGVNEKLLLETLAFIASHPSRWYQGAWRATNVESNRCKTPMCFAGHAAISLRGGVDLIPMPKARDFIAVEKHDATDEQRQRVSDWYTASDYLKPTPSEIKNGDAVDVELEDDVTVKGIGIQDRAKELLGRNAVWDKSTHRDLFGGENSLEQIVEHIARVTDKTADQVVASARKIAKVNKWRISADGFTDR